MVRIHSISKLYMRRKTNNNYALRNAPIPHKNNKPFVCSIDFDRQFNKKYERFFKVFHSI